MKPCAGMKTEIIRLGGGSPIYVKENHRQPKGNKSVILLITFCDAENHLEQPGISHYWWLMNVGYVVWGIKYWSMC